MCDYIFLQSITVFVWALINIIPIFGAYSLAKTIAKGKPFSLQISLSILLYLLQCEFAFGIMGIFGLLTQGYCGITIGITGFSLYFLSAKFDKKQPEEMPDNNISLLQNTRWIDRFLIFFCILIILNYIYLSTILSGTDTFLYHLYFPAQWLHHNKIFAVSQAGLPHEYFPVFGEILYGWFMLCGPNTPFIGLLQIIALLMALCSLAALWQSFNIQKTFIFISLFFLLSTGIIMENVCMCYTDSLTGSFLTVGICLFLIAFTGKGSYSFQNISLTLLSGLAMGGAASIKYSGLVLAPVITFMLLLYFFVKDIKEQKFHQRKYLYLTIIFSATFTASCYYMPNFLKTGNPFYPVKISLLFPQGIDFPRETVKFNELIKFFVNNNPWDMNIFSAVFYVTILLTALFWLFRRKNNNPDLKIFSHLAVILLIAEIIMLSIYPAMTQARQIIPLLTALCILSAPVLTGIKTEKYEKFIIPVLIIWGILMLRNPFSLRFITVQCTAAVFCVIAALPGKIIKSRIFILLIFITGLSIAFYGSFRRWESSLFLIKRYSSATICNGIYALRTDFRNSKTPLRIATVGTWFNYMLLMDMHKNTVEYVPINKKNTTHPHNFNNINDLRNDTVSYAEWLKRLQDGKFSHLVIDIESHQDYPANIDCELKWALAHPEQFKLLTSDGKIYFFKINQL